MRTDWEIFKNLRLMDMEEGGDCWGGGVYKGSK